MGRGRWSREKASRYLPVEVEYGLEGLYFICFICIILMTTILSFLASYIKSTWVRDVGASVSKLCGCSLLYIKGWLSKDRRAKITS